jgi:hypothetical protein
MILASAQPEHEAEFNRWYDREHMRERVEVPGFLSAQRYASTGDSPWRYLALYETEALDVFTSPVYRKALADQTPWSKSILAKFRDPQRHVTERTVVAGYGTAGYVSVVLVRPQEGRADAVREALASRILPDLASRDGVISASLLESDRGLSGPVAEYPKTSIDWVRPDDWYVIVGATSPEATALDLAALPGPESIAKAEKIGTFSLMWDLHRSDLG